MILTYSKDQFEAKIKAGIKIHTIREDKTNRWKEGMSIQHWRGNPRNVKLNPRQFGSDVCMGIQKILITKDREISVGDRFLTPVEIEALAINDGFESLRQFWAWFSEPFIGKIIHFTDFKY